MIPLRQLEVLGSLAAIACATPFVVWQAWSVEKFVVAMINAREPLVASKERSHPPWPPEPASNSLGRFSIVRLETLPPFGVKSSYRWRASTI
jgi:hypothetical protein